MHKDLVIVPVYNEARNIPAVICRIRETYPMCDIIIVNDGSTDDTAETAEKCGAPLISHPFNLGYGVAIQTGYKYAMNKGYEYLLQIDGDGQHDPGYIPNLFAEVKSGKCDIAIGSRFLIKSNYHVGLMKLAAIRLFRVIVFLITGQVISDPTSGYQCMNRKVFRYFADDGFPCDYPDANVIIALHRRGFRIRELPVAMYPNPEGRSMHRGIFNIMYYFFRVFLAIFVTLLTKKHK